MKEKKQRGKTRKEKGVRRETQKIEKELSQEIVRQLRPEKNQF